MSQFESLSPSFRESLRELGDSLILKTKEDKKQPIIVSFSKEIGDDVEVFTEEENNQ